MRRRQIWAARAAEQAAADLAAGTYSVLAPETPLDAIGIFTSAVQMAITKDFIIPAPKRRGRPPKVKRDV